MLAVTRRNLIKAQIQEKKSVTVPALAKKFEVTEETIRRDLKILEGEGVLSRTYGGAFIQNGVQNEVDFTVRMDAYVDSKTIIAESCRKLVSHGDSIYLDNSTTALFVAESLMQFRITVVTNSLAIINRLCGQSNIHLIAVGGSFDSDTNSFMGAGTLNALSAYHVDKAFLSCRSLSMEHGVTDSYEELAHLRRVILNRANESYLIADHSKFNYASFVKISGFEPISGIVTDKALSPEWRSFLAEKGIACYDGPTLPPGDC
ncbi:DeoR/GlpR family DNA-binding transcription regulator [Qiania dongpingensis]|uniref:DeoR/GlpR transcriptional regulator n=1 Tax=Qiania dongpingensis TaxID=2763669 RepID=A0A7G9G1Z7_9FIRM|nr:DeoR/GlpR family DNA-binding transcription regulator [Qiania dongpingensis]QNM04829.1 DeoR/GlpR transcriptional regulator [Qiania dongpingensis]